MNKKAGKKRWKNKKKYPVTGKQIHAHKSL